MKQARLLRFLPVALALVTLVTIRWVEHPLTLAQARSSSPSAQTCFIRSWHREVHHKADFTLTLALIGALLPQASGARR